MYPTVVSFFTVGLIRRCGLQAFQEEFVNNDRLNDNYRNGYGPASVHGFYMYTWAAHGMDKVREQ